MLHIKTFGDGIVGDGLVHIARDALGLSLAMLKHTSAYFRNGAAGERFILISPLLKDLEKRAQFIKEYKQQYASVDNAYKDKWLPPGTEVKQGASDPDKSQLVESRQFDLIQVADLLNIPPHKLGANISTSYSSLQSENQAFLDDCLDFWLVSWQQEIEAKLFSENEKAGDLRSLDFDRSELLRMDPKTEGELRIQKLNNGVISWEECRHLEDLPPEKDEEQEWRHPSNIVVEGDEPEPEPEPEPVQAPLAEQEPVEQEPVEQEPEPVKEEPPTKEARSLRERALLEGNC